jgi:eukaryotic-like serine/threonine-protein kinase
VWEVTLDGTAGKIERAAMKVSHSSDSANLARLSREAAILQMLGPPHVPAFIRNGILRDGRPYLAMERAIGRTLADELAYLSEPPALDTVRALGGALLDATVALHARGVFHRDLKPENVFLAGDGESHVARLVDFGLALSGETAAPLRTSSSIAAGTPEYMAPERISGEDGDLRSDVYALGALLFEMATLRPPFVGDRREVEYAHLSFRPPPPSRFTALPRRLETIILRCLAKEPGERFADALALRRAFTEALAHPGSEAADGGWVASDSTALNRGTRQQVALIFMQTADVTVIDIQAAVQPFGGQLAHLAGDRSVCAFTHRAGDHPGQRALAAAEALVAAGLTRRLIVDLGTVTVKPRASGPPRVSGAVFSEPSRFPRAEHPDAVLMTAAARDLLPSTICRPVPGFPGLFALVPREDQDLIKTVELTEREAPGLLFGRDDDLSALHRDAARALAERRSGAAIVVAESGVGKTRLRFELAHLVQMSLPETEVIELSAKEAVGPESDEALAELLRRTLDLPRQPPFADRRQLLLERLGESPSEAAAAGLVLGWLSPDDSAVRLLQAAPGVLRANVARAGMAALRRLARRRPVIVLLDDAQWADDALLDALEQATVAELPLWVCAFARPTFAASRPAWGQRAASQHTTMLQPLDRADAAELCRHLLEPASHVPHSVIERLVDRTEGVPRLIHDLIRGLRRQGLVRKQASGVSVVASGVLDRLSDSPVAEWLVGWELDQLPPELAAHARLVSILPTEFTVEELQGVLGEMERPLLDAFPLDARIGLQRLQHAGLVVRRSTGRLSFRTEGVREAVARTVDDLMARRIHRAALSYHRSTPAGSSERLSRVGWHAAGAGDRAGAAAAYLELAEGAQQRHKYFEAEMLYSRSLGQLGEDAVENRLRVFRGRGIMRYRLGRHDDSLADLARAWELAVIGSSAFTRTDVLLDESMALDWLFDWPRSRELAERAQALMPEDAPAALRARVLLARGRSLHRFNRDAEAAVPLRQAERLAESAGDEGYEVQVIADLLLGLILPMLGETSEAQERLSRVQQRCEEKGDELHLAAMWNNRSCLWIAHNDRERFMEDNTLVRAYARRLGNPNLDRWAHLNAAYFLYWRGEFEAALPFVRRMIEIDERCFRQGGFRPDGALLMARILWAQGAEAKGASTIADVRRHQAAARAAGQRALLLLPNDEMLLDMTTLLVEGGDTAAWEALVGRARQVAQGQEIIEVLELAGVAAERRGNLAGARRWWHEALEVGRRIPNVMGERIRQRLEVLG